MSHIDGEVNYKDLSDKARRELELYTKLTHNTIEVNLDMLYDKNIAEKTKRELVQEIREFIVYLKQLNNHMELENHLLVTMDNVELKRSKE